MFRFVVSVTRRIMCSTGRRMLFLYWLFRGGTKCLQKVWERLAQWKREREAQQGWFESCFQHSPWLTTLISTLLGPLIILILLLTFGPCILNHLVSFIRKCLNTIQIMTTISVSFTGWRERFLYKSTKTGGKCEAVMANAMTGSLD